ncbi:MAG: thioredoxin domain-containing protein [Candidatus Latescibacterota bacterium]|nr:MAG: thioredoxin domain-containing protein [Candidatus Latescibacterota bacterium]
MSAPGSNRLAQETSPYLLQHANNPVDWHPWGEEALRRSRAEQKPIFLSVGYSSCHWCHVMEQESFEDEETARLMNDLFVNIKVDREERPDLDEIYMHAVQLFSGGHGGWPMSVFLTPELQPYYAGTYFPPQSRHGMPSFRGVLQSAAAAWAQRRDDVVRTSQEVVDALQQMTALHSGDGVPGPETFDAAFTLLQRSFDDAHGGFGSAPKFPHPMEISFLLRFARRTGNDEASRMALHTLRKMARGGIYDQLRGGFHRYATDERWLVPHFEKMLYDNALLARAYIEAYQVTGESLFSRIAAEVLDFVSAEMTTADGAFCSAQDADSEGVEGRYFVWSADEIDDVCGATEGRIVRAYFGVTPSGNFEPGASVLSVPRDEEVVAVECGVGVEELRHLLQRARAALLARRGKRLAPGLDDKVIAAWNGLTIRAFAQAHRVLQHPQALARARSAARFILERSETGLFRTWKAERPSGPGFLDDYANMIAALLDLYEASFEPEWLEAAQKWNEVVLEEFLDAEGGGFFYTGPRHETLIARSRSYLDNAVPSGNSVQTSNLLRLGLLTGEKRLREVAARTLRALAGPMRQFPTAMGEMLCSLDLFLGPAAEVAVTGRGAGAETLAREIFAPFAPNKVVAGWPAAGAVAKIALLANRGLVEGAPAAYVCRGHACQAPVTAPESARQALLRATGSGAET